MISTYVHNGHFHVAIGCFYQLLLVPEIRPNFYTFPLILKACGTLVDGRKIHCRASKLGFQWNVFVAASLIHMYSQFDFTGIARSPFNDNHFEIWVLEML